MKNRTIEHSPQKTLSFLTERSEVRNLSVSRRFLATLGMTILLVMPGIKTCFSQQSKADSLKTELAKLSSLSQVEDKWGADTTKVALLNKLCLEYEFEDRNLAKHYVEESLKLAQKINYQKGIASSYMYLGYLEEDAGNYQQAISNYEHSLKISEQNGDKKAISASFGNFGNVYYNQGDYPKALDYYFRALKVDEELGNSAKGGSASGGKNGIATRLGNIGMVYDDQSDYPKALEYYFKALKMREELGAKNLITTTLYNIGSLYFTLKRYKEAEEYLLKSLAIAEKIGSLDDIRLANKNLSDLYSQTNRYQLAWEHYNQYSIAKDTLYNEEKSKDIGKLEAKREYEMAEFKHRQEEKEQQRVLQETVERRSNLQYTAILIALFIIFSAVFLLGLFRLPNWAVELSVFMPFLLLFEFTLVLLDTYIDAYTGEEPAYKLLINAALAAAIFPLHSYLEKKLKSRVSAELHGKNTFPRSLLLFWITTAVVASMLLHPKTIARDIEGKERNTNPKIALLLDSLAHAPNDSVRLHFLNELSWEYRNVLPQNAVLYANEGIKLAEKTGNKKQIAALKKNLAVIYKIMADYSRSIKYLFSALKIYESMGDSSGIAACYGNLGIAYRHLKNYELAVDNFKRTLNIFEKQMNIRGISATYTNLGLLMEEMGKDDQAVQYYDSALEICVKYGFLYGELITRLNLGKLFLKQRDYKAAFKLFSRSLEIADSAGEPSIKAVVYQNLAELNWELGNRDTANQQLAKSIYIAKELNLSSLLMENYRLLASHFAKVKNYREALEIFRLHVELKDSIFNEENSKEIGKLEAKYELEKAEVERKKAEEEQQRQFAAAVERRNLLQYSGILIFLVILAVGFLLLAKANVPTRFAEGVIFFIFLLFFEFLLVLLDPYIEQWIAEVSGQAGEEPLWKLVFNAGIAALIFPLHAFFEGLLKKRLFKLKREIVEKRNI